jgi:RNA polymerase sigma-70 factor (ECF subfamily)
MPHDAVRTARQKSLDDRSSRSLPGLSKPPRIPGAGRRPAPGVASLLRAHVGSIADRDIVQKHSLGQYALPVSGISAVAPWLFRIAHNRALDHLRRYEHRMSEPIDAAPDIAVDDADPEGALAREHATHAAVSRFVELAPAQRSCVILKDVLGHSLEEIATLLELSLPAVKAALHRGRVRLRDELANVAEVTARPASPVVARYAELFNARDWDGVRAMLADDVRLDLVQRSQRAGRRESCLFHQLRPGTDWRLRPAWPTASSDRRVSRAGDERPGYFIELTAIDGRIAVIRDFRYVPYVAREAEFRFARRRSLRLCCAPAFPAAGFGGSVRTNASAS